MLYISPEYISWLQKNGEISVKGTLYFAVPLTVHAAFYRMFNAVHQHSTAQSNRTILEKEFEACMVFLFDYFSAERPSRKIFDFRERVQEIQNYIEYHYQKSLNLEKLSQKFHLSKYQLIRIFKDLSGVTPNEYLNILRIEKEKNYILQSNSLVLSALEAGFYDQSHFTHYFTRYTSFTPRQFQRGGVSSLSSFRPICSIM